MRALSRLKIGPRIYVVIVLMAILTIGIGWMGIFSMDRYESQSNQMSSLTDRALLSERVLAQLTELRLYTRDVYLAKNDFYLGSTRDRAPGIVFTDVKDRHAGAKAAAGV